MRTNNVTARDCWTTPPALVDAVSELIQRPFWIDLAAEEHNKKAPLVLADTLAEDPATIARRAPLGAAAWCNPPYSVGNLRAFAQWCQQYASAGGTVAMLVPASQSDGWWRDHVAPACSMIIVPDRRVAFHPPAGSAVTASTNRGQNLIAVLSPGAPREKIDTIRVFW